MSLVLSLKQAPAETLDLLLARPELAVVFWMNPDYTPPKTPALLTWIAKLLGHYEPPIDLPEAPSALCRTGEELVVDNSPITTAAFDDLNLGKPILGSTHGYGDDRAVWPGEIDRLEQDQFFGPLTERTKDYLDSACKASLGFVMKLS